jgi:anthranilate phosphoribosyltransferase
MSLPGLAAAICAARLDAATRPFLLGVQRRLAGPAVHGSAIDEAIEQLRAGGTLDEAAARAACLELVEGSAADETAGTLLALLAPERLSPETIAAFARVMREHATPVRPRLAPGAPLLDTCGTGGDGLGTFNVSTTVAFVAAAAGVAVAKHGNRAATSQSGSADVLEALGVSIDLDGEQVARCIERVGLGFMFAQRFHPAYRNVQRVRQRLTQEALPGVPARTVFNILGPLANPAAATHQVLGVSVPSLVPTLAAVLGRLGVVRALVVCGETDRVGVGMDEVSTSGVTHAVELDHGRCGPLEISPEEFGLRRVPVAALAGGDAMHNAGLVRAILQGTAPAAHTEIVLLNAAAALYVAGVCESLGGGVAKARALIASGAALGRLEALQGYAV